jgi:hypothetical protein
MPNRPGAPEGNQNARKHGFYSRLLDKKDRSNYHKALSIEGLDGEINVLRAKIMTLLELDPDNLPLLIQASATLARLLRTRQMLSGSREEKLRRAVQRTLAKSPFTDIDNL